MGSPPKKAPAEPAYSVEDPHLRIRVEHVRGRDRVLIFMDTPLTSRLRLPCIAMRIPHRSRIPLAAPLLTPRMRHGYEHAYCCVPRQGKGLSKETVDAILAELQKYVRAVHREQNMALILFVADPDAKIDREQFHRVCMGAKAGLACKEWGRTGEFAYWLKLERLRSTHNSWESRVRVARSVVELYLRERGCAFSSEDLEEGSIQFQLSMVPPGQPRVWLVRAKH